MIRGALALVFALAPAAAGPLDSKHACPKICEAGDYIAVERSQFGQLLAERDAMVAALMAQERELDRLRSIVWGRNI